MQSLVAVFQRRGLRSLTQLCTATNVLQYSTYEFTDTKFIDKIRVKAKAGDGGSGCDSVWKSNKKGKFKPPDGGNGGRGGDVIVEACSLVKSLSNIRFTQKAGRGGQGRSQKQAGVRGADRIIKVPVGTTINYMPGHGSCDRNTSSVFVPLKHDQAAVHDHCAALLEQHHGNSEGDEQVSSTESCAGEQNRTLRRTLADLTAPGASVIVALGGRGGRGNAALRSTSNRPAPRLSEQGQPGEEVLLELELRLLADVGFVGAPNAGKSTLLRALSNARPRVGTYAFTTLHPQLGVLSMGERRTVIADIPGLIAGASGNRGLGHVFLRHIERTSILAFVVDLSTGLQGCEGLQPSVQLKMLQDELYRYSPLLLQKPGLVVANKIDLLDQHTSALAVKKLQQSTSLPVIAVSALEQEGISALTDALTHCDFPHACKDIITSDTAKESSKQYEGPSN
ncbi:GTPase Obg [Coccomyxa sp. Obi]|nr:GTPase Obg [Coccomyxa sp. Obi]